MRRFVLASCLVLTGCPIPAEPLGTDAGTLSDAPADVPVTSDAGAALGGPCSNDGRVECDGYEATHTCADHDGDGALEWGPSEPCPGTSTCERAACTETCTDDCHLGQIGCFPDENARTCGQYDRDACADWSPDVACGPDRLCNSLGPELCVECLDDDDHQSCGTDALVCRNQECVPPPGACFEAGTEGTLEVPAGSATGHVSFFYALTGVTMGQGMAFWLGAPDGTFVYIDRCITPADGTYTELLTDDRDLVLGPLAGHVGSGTWTLTTNPCRGGPPPGPGELPPSDGTALENWAVCFTP